MTVTLSPELEALIRQKVESGRFNDPVEVIEEALLQMDERDRLADLRALIAEAEEEFARGEFVAWTPDLMDRLIRESEENSRNGVPIPDHVKP
jgi:antitoxin ParD1/3/4